MQNGAYFPENEEGGSGMRFDNEKLFVSLVTKHGMNLYLGAGFSVYAYNDDDEPLPLGNEINRRLIDLFQLKKGKTVTFDMDEGSLIQTIK